MAKKVRRVFEWDATGEPDSNTDHIAVHGLTPADAERIVLDPRNPQDRSRSSGYPIKFGRTSENRYVAVVYFGRGDNPEVIRVITTYDVPPPQPPRPKGGRR